MKPWQLQWSYHIWLVVSDGGHHSLRGSQWNQAEKNPEKLLEWLRERGLLFWGWWKRQLKSGKWRLATIFNYLQSWWTECVTSKDWSWTSGQQFTDDSFKDWLSSQYKDNNLPTIRPVQQWKSLPPEGESWLSAATEGTQHRMATWTEGLKSLPILRH